MSQRDEVHEKNRQYAQEDSQKWRVAVVDDYGFEVGAYVVITKAVYSDNLSLFRDDEKIDRPILGYGFIVNKFLISNVVCWKPLDEVQADE